MSSLFAMRRANGDWFALDDKGSFRVPVFHNSAAAMVARSRETGMECFRPVLLDELTFKNLTTTDGGKASYWLVEDPLMKLNRGRAMDHQELAGVMRNGTTTR
ncbi:MAG TPA: hypothetical protein VHR36_14440 [Pyrinomonadaceae bacterium]|jgi:hypothetical protein|nr:hypothetical protein [Pyrinomonadaceae bacterium]